MTFSMVLLFVIISADCFSAPRPWYVRIKIGFLAKWSIVMAECDPGWGICLSLDEGSGQNFLGWPTYVVICPDRTLFFDPCYPPTVTGFDPYFGQCASTVGTDDHEITTRQTGFLSLFPNPAKYELSIEIYVKDHFPVIIEFFNLLGKKVVSFSFEVFPGEQTISISTDELQNGAYFIRMVQNGQIKDVQKSLISR